MRPSPKAYKLEQELKSLPLDELERLLYRMGPKSPVGYPPNPNTVKQPEKKAILPHASSTMYTQKQTVDVKKSYDGYLIFLVQLLVQFHNQSVYFLHHYFCLRVLIPTVIRF